MRRPYAPVLHKDGGAAFVYMDELAILCGLPPSPDQQEHRPPSFLGQFRICRDLLIGRAPFLEIADRVVQYRPSYSDTLRRDPDPAAFKRQPQTPADPSSGTRIGNGEDYKPARCGARDEPDPSPGLIRNNPAK